MNHVFASENGRIIYLYLKGLGCFCLSETCEDVLVLHRCFREGWLCMKVIVPFLQFHCGNLILITYRLRQNATCNSFLRSSNANFVFYICTPTRSDALEHAQMHAHSNSHTFLQDPARTSPRRRLIWENPLQTPAHSLPTHLPTDPLTHTHTHFNEIAP